MSLRQLADVAYAMLVERIERQAHTERIVSAILAAAGGKTELVDPAQRRAHFDAVLIAEPKEIDPDQWVLMEALGVGRGYHHR